MGSSPLHASPDFAPDTSHPSDTGLLLSRRQLFAKTSSQVGNDPELLLERRRDLAILQSQLRMQQQPGDGGFELNPNRRRRGLVGQGALALAASERQANLAGQPLCPGEGEVDLYGNGKARELPDLLRACRVAVENPLVDNESGVFIVLERSKSSLAALHGFALLAEDAGQCSGAVFRPFHAGNYENLHALSPW